MPAATGLAFDDHPGFHRVALATGGAATVGAAAAALGPATIAGWEAFERFSDPLRMGARLCAIAAGVGAASVAGSWALTPLALAAVLIIGAPRARLAWAAPIAALAAAAAVWAADRVLGAAALASWSAPAIDAASGLFLGCIAAGALAGRHLAVQVDPILAAWRALPPLVGEPKALAERGLAIWHDTQTMRADDRALVAGGLTTLFAVAAKASTAPAIDAASIDVRIAELDLRIAACTDAIAAAQFKDARAALADQQRYAASVAASRERIVARMHHCVATLETFRLACAHADASAAAREAADARTAVAVLADLSDGLSEAARATDAPADEPSALPAAAS